MRTARDPDSIRPGLLVLAAAVLGCALLVAGSVLRDVVLGGSGSASIEDDAGGRDPETGGRRVRLLADRDDDERGSVHGVDDPGPEGSVREQWAEATREGALRQPLPPLVEAIADPQMSAYHRSFGAEDEVPFVPTERRGRLASARGLDIPPGSSCDVRVLPVVDATYNCLVRVTCGGVVVYPNQAQTAGYVSCELGGGGPRRAVDGMPTVTDGDPAVALDLDSGRVTVGDRDHASSLYDVTIELEPGARYL